MKIRQNFSISAVFFLLGQLISVEIYSQTVTTSFDFSKWRAEVIQRESEITIEKNKLREKGLSTKDFIEKVVIPLKNKSDSEVIQQVLISQDKSESEIKSYIKKWQSHQKEFQERFNQSILDKQAYFIEKSMNEIESMKGNLLEENNKDYLAIKKEYSTWKQSKKLLAGPEQKDRLYSFYNFFAKAAPLLKKFYGGRIDENVTTPLSTWDIGIGGLAMGCGGAKVLGNSLWNRKRGEGDTPLTLNFNEIFQGLKKFSGVKTNVSGRENMPSLEMQSVEKDQSEGPVVNLFLPSHRNPLLDAILMSELNLPHYLLFANPKAFLPVEFLGQRLASSPEFIGVGGWRGAGNKRPNEKMVESLRARVSSNVLNYPQGFTSTMNEIIAPTDVFDKKLLGYLVAEGFRPNIVPISYEVGSPFLRLGEKVKEKEVEAKIAPNLPPSVVKLLLKMAEEDSSMEQGVSLYLRGSWIENIEHHAELSLEEMEKRWMSFGGVDEKVTLNPIYEK